ncbi:hypothetical protein [Aminobacter phage Erebus]|nr:hypothetical protein [Aminobacter phage Erebus]
MTALTPKQTLLFGILLGKGLGPKPAFAAMARITKMPKREPKNGA